MLERDAEILRSLRNGADLQRDITGIRRTDYDAVIFYLQKGRAVSVITRPAHTSSIIVLKRLDVCQCRPPRYGCCDIPERVIKRQVIVPVRLNVCSPCTCLVVAIYGTEDFHLIVPAKPVIMVPGRLEIAQ